MPLVAMNDAPPAQPGWAQGITQVLGAGVDAYAKIQAAKFASKQASLQQKQEAAQNRGGGQQQSGGGGPSMLLIGGGVLLAGLVVIVLVKAMKRKPAAEKSA